MLEALSFLEVLEFTLEFESLRLFCAFKLPVMPDVVELFAVLELEVLGVLLELLEVTSELLLRLGALVVLPVLLEIPVVSPLSDPLDEFFVLGVVVSRDCVEFV